MARVKLIEIAHARSGDKGDTVKRRDHSLQTRILSDHWSSK